MRTLFLPLFILSLLAGAAFADEECPPRYSYCGYSGPAQWPNITIEHKTNECGGLRQSPITLPRIGSASPTPGPRITFQYLAGKATIRNTGHDILVTPTGDAGTMKIGDGLFKLVQFHIHVPPEHVITGLEPSAELHIVHQPLFSATVQYGVIAVMLTMGPGYPGPALKPVFEKLPVSACTQVEATIEFNNLLPNQNWSYYTYTGSLTTPPCTQSVNWFVLYPGGHIDVFDLTKLVALGANARPVQNNVPPLPVTWVVNPSK